MSLLAPGTAFGPYEILALVGRGGMSEVYRVRETRLGRIEALKVMIDGQATASHAVERFLNDARIAARLRHPNIVNVYMVGENAGRPFIAMEHIEGESLEELLSREGRLGPKEAHTLLAQIASALDAAHAQDVIHRDVKPANVLVRALDGGLEAKVVDFGIARSADVGRGLTQEGMLMGTPEYMSPEQAEAPTTVGPCSDQYSLAIVAYEALCGRPPFLSTELGGTMAVVLAHARTAPPRPRIYAPNLPSHVEQALLRALSKHPQARFGSCSAFIAALAPPQAAPVKKKEPNRPVIAILGLAALGVVLVLASFWGSCAPPKEPSPSPLPADSSDVAVDRPAPASSVDVPPVDPTVPGLVGLSRSEAQERLLALGLDADVRTVYDDAPAGRIVSQSPASGATLPKGGEVALLASLGKKPPPAAPRPVARRLSASDLVGKSKLELDYMRNEIYARHGYRFRRADLRSHFSQFSWYHPDTGDIDVVSRRLTERERADAGLILSYQRRSFG